MLLCVRRRLPVMAGFIIVCCFFFNFVIKQPNNESLVQIDEFTDDFSNETGADGYIVPNIIHFIRYQKFELNFVDYVVLKAAMRNHRPDHFYYHTNIKNVTYDGKYWDWVRKDEQNSGPAFE